MKAIIRHERLISDFNIWQAAEFLERAQNLLFNFRKVKVNCFNDQYTMIENYYMSGEMSGEFSMDYLRHFFHNMPEGACTCVLEVMP